MFASKLLVNQLKLNQSNLNLIHLMLKASICHKSELPPQKNVYRWPYETREYNWYNCLLDPFTLKKFNDNSKVIQIEGNVACGKKDFAQRLANELGMKLIPDIDLESYFINDHGYDYRALNPLLPERLRLCDWEMFHENPTRHSMVHMLFWVFKLRIYQYIIALQHLFNTGQGVVLVRSAVTDRVFVEAMHNIGWLPTGHVRGDGVRFYDFKTRYIWIRNLALAAIPKPHLTIYLETPVDTCLNRIKNSSDPMIANSKALVPEFLENIEKAYKDVILPKQEYNGHILSYDYPERATDEEILDVVDDISKLDFTYDHHDFQFNSWNADDKTYWYLHQRTELTSMRCLTHFEWLQQPWYDIAGLGDSITEVDLKMRETLYEANVGDLGWFRSLGSNPSLRPFTKVYFDRMNFGERLKKAVYCDHI